MKESCAIKKSFYNILHFNATPAPACTPSHTAIPACLPCAAWVPGTHGRAEMLTRVSEIFLKRTSTGNLRVSFNQFVLGHLSEPDLFFSSHFTQSQFYFLYLTRTSQIPPLALKLSLTGHIDTCCWNSPVCSPSPVTWEVISPGPFF